ncbi:MAG: hypothetical protein L6R42_008953 [Xanthoria sp. 1 TBL-2021]|nr:MAG: hypothetical protein L6R42_008953 [Xanthoria sp. 1 TBL-2021]
MTAPSPQQRLQSLSEEYQKLQTDLQTQITSRQRLESQQQENLAVRKEFNTLSDDSTIYQLIGPVLLKQEKTEAESAVDGRLEFIEKEIKRVEKLVSDMQEQSEGKKMEVSRRDCVLFYHIDHWQVYQLQMKMQEAK